MSWLMLKPNVVWALAGVFAILIAASLLVVVLKARAPQKDFSELVQRIKSWWIMITVFTVAIVLSRNVSIVFFALISFLALKEYLSLIPTRRADRRIMFWAYLTIPIQYYWVGIEWYGMFIIFIPVYAFLYLPTRMVLIGVTDRFLAAAGSLHWGLMMTVFCLSHVAFLLVLPTAGNPVAGGAGLVLFLVFLTQFNDVAQYTWGKLFGRTPIVPSVSPKKTWEGFAGGVLTTTLLATVLAKYLTPLNLPEAALAGALIGAGGFIGDVIISAIKRDIGVKDSGSLLPGHGGILDRVDSLTYTAPLFFHYVFYLHF
ncbi:MAG: phosphatidate cytidylyltransferase [Proteobacteria bacterium]|jgi:phosphatidate cytidylyltransferase|nr:phosphatidate cytidylyltransferase [Pseudomonadota bacterium]MCG6936535.1 phosphatidate cytidylyltransferase [Pseudomonadota bacterium]